MYINELRQLAIVNVINDNTNNSIPSIANFVSSFLYDISKIKIVINKNIIVNSCIPLFSVSILTFSYAKFTIKK